MVRRLEKVLAAQPEVVNYVSTVGTSGPIDFNGMFDTTIFAANHIRPKFASTWLEEKSQSAKSRDRSTSTQRIGEHCPSRTGKIQIVELPPGPPVMASVVAEVYGREDSTYTALLQSAATVADRMRREPGIAEVDEIREAKVVRYVFDPDQEKAALSGVTVADIARTIQIALQGDRREVLRVEGERNPLALTIRLPRPMRSSPEDLSQIGLKNAKGTVVPLRELGKWRTEEVGQTIYHKNLKRVAYVFAECVGRPPADCVVDI